MTKVTKAVKQSNKKQCLKCTKEKDVSEFYMSSSVLYTDKKLPVCKDCLESFVVGSGKDTTNSLTSLMRMIDRPFLHEEWKAAMSYEKPFGEYMRRIAMRQNRDLTWEDSTHTSVKTANFTFENVLEEEIDLTQEDINELVKFWGKGFDIESYLWLQNEFEDFVNRYECDSKGMELLIKQVCLTELDIENRRSNNEKVDQQLKTLQDLLGSSNLKPVQETGANAVEQESFGTLIKKFERDKPIPEADPEWKDVDGIGKYVRTFFLGHMARALGIENKYQEEYDDEVNKYTVVQDEDGDNE